jgi:hypothetical protein
MFIVGDDLKNERTRGILSCRHNKINFISPLLSTWEGYIAQVNINFYKVRALSLDKILFSEYNLEHLKLTGFGFTDWSDEHLGSDTPKNKVLMTLSNKFKIY